MITAPRPERQVSHILLLSCLLASVLCQMAFAVSAQHLPAQFLLEVNDRRVHHSIDFEPVMPGQEVVFSSHRQLASRMAVTVNGKPLKRSQNSFTWQAPAKAGHFTAQVVLTQEGGRGTTQQITVQLFVVVPATAVKNGWLNGYRIGTYPSPLRNLSAYRAPAGFIEVTPDNVGTAISPNFTLGQFLCKQESGYPKYLVLQPRLLTKLEALLREVNDEGFAAPSFVVMSGYRTPYYNAAIGNVPSSYHVYGGAADIYVDVAPQDGVMDDLNRDGRQNRRDAAFLYGLADSFVTRHNWPELLGGVGEYGSNAAHGPFVHIDVRGIRARWGHVD